MHGARYGAEVQTMTAKCTVSAARLRKRCALPSESASEIVDHCSYVDLVW